MKKILLVITILLCLCLSASGFHPALKGIVEECTVSDCTTVVLDESAAEAGSNLYLARYHENGASPFVAGDWGPICGVTVYLNVTGSPSMTWTFDIQTDSSGSPSGSTVGSASSSTDVSSGGEIFIPMAAGQLTNTNTYWIHAHSDSENGTDYVTWQTTDGTTESILTADDDDLPSYTTQTTTKTYRYKLHTQ